MVAFFRRLLIGLVLCLVLIAVPLSVSENLRDQASHLVEPVVRPLISVQSSLGSTLLSLRQIGTLRQDKNNLEKQVLALQQSLADEEAVKRENDVLRKELGISGATQSLPKAFAHVILKGSNPLDRTFTIDIGSNQGVKVGQPAIQQGQLIGKVITVRSHTAIIRSITSQQSIVQAWVVDNTEKGLLIGDGNSVYLKELTQGIKFNDGSVVETSGLGGSLPQGILIGTLGTIQSKPSDLTQSFLVKLSQDPSGIESVFIVLTDVP
jgi:rod shape-determining protein MreC